MDCQNVKDNLENYLANCLSRREALAMEKHLEGCPACRTLLLKEDEEMDELLATRWYTVQTPAMFTEEVMEKIMLQKKPKKQFTRSKIVACIVGIVVYCLLWFSGFCGYLLIKSIPPQVFPAVGVAIRSLLEHYSLTPLGTAIFLAVLALINWGFYYLDRKERMA